MTKRDRPFAPEHPLATERPSAEPVQSLAAAAPTVLVPRGGRFVGVVAFYGSAEIEGEVEGPIRATGVLRLGGSAIVRGAVEVDELIVAGLVEGDVRARCRVKLESGATVRGTLVSPVLAMADGAVVEGECRLHGESR
jgi:cytoskeletal protein CcmA (bactofilin family)